ncbi:YnhF family membrane protein [Vibrio sp. SM6]|uniref:YnhF family membrane protein n=1 Tax=Vibrio agarilyticus TaxID=2726741 RepID=A0A7X8TMJ1_9VIBR|nr:YnhF family membrane protein [Vibrio agarilyticus]NLS11495.1 YnhF family membrane protein [Vibrio agarilyticus]
MEYDLKLALWVVAAAFTVILSFGFVAITTA